MPKPCRSLKNDYQFRRAYHKGKNSVSPCLVCYCFKRKSGGIHIGITTGKKIGNAVKRSRARRVIREAARLLSPYMRGSWEIVFVARTRTPFCKMQIIMEQMREQLVKMGIITESLE